MKRTIAMIVTLAMILSLMGAMGIVSTTAEGVDPKGVYVTPLGAGAKDGSSFDNAMEGDRSGGLTAAWDKAGETGTVYVGSGNYAVPQTLSIATSGKSVDELKSLVGVDTGAGKPVFIGQSTLDEQEGTLIEIQSGASFVRIDNLKIEKYCYPISTRGKHIGMRFLNLDTYEMADGIYLRGGAKAEDPLVGNKDIIVDNCNFIKYTKSAIRMLDGNNGVLISNCVGDAGGKEFSNSKSFALGFHVLGGDGVYDENITYVNCVAMNAWQDPTGGMGTYWNGDGFCSEENIKNLTYIRCRAYNNTDGGWDDKAPNPTLIDCITMNNKRNWRFWTSPTIINSLDVAPKHPASGEMDAGMWSGRYSTPKIYNTTFYDAPLLIELGGLELYDTILVRTSEGGFFDEYLKEGENLISRGVITWNGKEGTDPKIKDPTDFRFDGKSDKYNSLTFGAAKGYYYQEDIYNSKIMPTKDIKAGGIADVTETYSWAKDSINDMVAKEFMPGITSGAFAPYANMTRIQFAAMLVRALGIKATAAGNFTDMERFKKWKDPIYGKQYYNDIAIAKAAGVVKGNETGLFNPGETITRQDMMVMLGRALKIAGKMPQDFNADLGALNAFSDKDNIADYAKQEVANVIEKGIIKGADGAINPIGNATRAEGAVIGKRIA